MNIDKTYEKLAFEIDCKNIEFDVSMKEYTSFKAGGKAKALVKPNNIEELANLLKVLHKNKINHLIIGNGSNILVKDEGYDGVVVKLSGEFSNVETKGNLIVAGSSVLLSAASREAQSKGLSGLEFAAGIPGTVGGAVFMNAGAYDGEISKVISCATLISKDGSEIKKLDNKKLGLSYRHSNIQETGDIVLSAEFILEEKDKEEIENKMKDFAKRRSTKQPLTYPSAGSFFKRPEGYFAGQLVEEAGLKGLTHGGAQVSTLHAGFIINTGTATGADIINLMEIVKATVFERSGVMLEPEVRIIGE